MKSIWCSVICLIYTLTSIMNISTVKSYRFGRYLGRKIAILPRANFATSAVSTDSQLSNAPKLNYYDTNKEDIGETFKLWKEPKFRSQQVHQWVYDKGIVSFDEMKDLPVTLRTKLKDHFTIGNMKIASELVSKDGTRKRAYELHDGQIIESVLMPYEDGRRTACISSQAGCAMGCVFCATGQMGFARQLTSSEIFEQAQAFSAELRRKGERLSNVVFMGMGEPLANYENVMTAVRRLNDELGIGARHITLSTVGLAPRIRKLAEEDIQVGLAISLHQTDEAKRSALMPVNNRYPVADLLEACRYYISRTNRRISFEWALIRGETDTEATAHELGQLLFGMLCHVNLIPLNPTKGFNGKPSPKESVDAFIKVLETYGVTATPRTRRGIDINAGCGQLTADLMRKMKLQQQQSGGSATPTSGCSKVQLPSPISREEEDRRLQVAIQNDLAAAAATEAATAAPTAV